MRSLSRVERLSTEKIAKLLWKMSSQPTFSLLVYAIYNITDTYFRFPRAWGRKFRKGLQNRGDHDLWLDLH